jgi:hypothetical protein
VPNGGLKDTVKSAKIHIRPKRRSRNMSELDDALARIHNDDVKDAFKRFKTLLENQLDEQRANLTRMVIAISIILGILIVSVFVALWAHDNFVQDQARIENGAVQTAVSEIYTKLTPSITPTPTTTGTPTKLPTSTLVPTATLIPAATVTSTPTPKYSIEFSKWGLSKLGMGVYRLGIKAYLHPKGTMDFDAAVWAVDQTVQAFLLACPKEGRFTSGSSYPPGNFFYSSESGMTPVSDKCWKFLEDLTGVKPVDKIPAGTVGRLRNYTDTSPIKTLFIGNDGAILGVWKDSLPPLGKSCFYEGLKLVGYREGGYFPLVPFGSDPVPSDILYEVGFNSGWPEIPDFCFKGQLSVVSKPEWITVTQNSDGFLLETNQEKRSWAKFTRDEESTSRWWAWEPVILKDGSAKVEYRPRGTFGELDLIAISKGLSCQGVFLRIEGRQLVWYQSNILGCYLGMENWENRIASVYLTPWFDSVNPHVMVKVNPLPYRIGEKIIQPPGGRLY